MTESAHSECDVARVRVRNYLRALQVTNEEREAEIVPQILARIQPLTAEQAKLRAAVPAIEELRAAIGEWLIRVLPSREHVTMADYLALLVIDASKQWPAAFLAEEIPAGLPRALQNAQVRAGPELQVSSMVPEPFENPLLGSLPLRNALAMLARSLPKPKKAPAGNASAKLPPPAG